MTNLKILVIDDVKENLKVFKIALQAIQKDLGFDLAVECVDSAEEALKILNSGTQDLILCDERLGGMNGTQLYAEIRLKETDSNWIPFVLISAKNTSKDWMEFYKSGVTDFIPKPVAPDKLLFLCRWANKLKKMKEESDKNLQICKNLEATLAQYKSVK